VPSCYDKAVQLLGSRPHFRRELQAKLAKRGFPAEEIEEALDRLAGHGYLDDRKTALSFVAQRLERHAGNTEGRLRLKAELEKRGAAPEAVASALADVPEDDLESARDAAERWARLHPRGKGTSLAQHLARKGFSRRAIFAVLTERREDLDLDGIEE
jgi:regulatory protein